MAQPDDGLEVAVNRVAKPRQSVRPDIRAVTNMTRQIIGVVFRVLGADLVRLLPIRVAGDDQRAVGDITVMGADLVDVVAQLLVEGQSEETFGFAHDTVVQIRRHTVVTYVKEPDVAASIVQRRHYRVETFRVSAEQRREVDDRNRLERHTLGAEDPGLNGNRRSSTCPAPIAFSDTTTALNRNMCVADIHRQQPHERLARSHSPQSQTEQTNYHKSDGAGLGHRWRAHVGGGYHEHRQRLRAEERRPEPEHRLRALDSVSL